MMQAGSVDDQSGKGAAVGSTVHHDALQNNNGPPSAAGTTIYDQTPINVIAVDRLSYQNKSKAEAVTCASKKSLVKGGGASKKTKTVSGRWTTEEHEAFLRGLKVYGREWKKVAVCIPTRTSAQIRSHAQKYFAKIQKDLAMPEKRLSLPDEVLKPKDVHSDQPLSQSYVDTVNFLMQDPSEIETRVCKTLASLRERYQQLEDGLRQKQALPTPELQVSSGPATAALALEQQSLRRAAEARYEIKKREMQSERTQSASIGTAPSVPSSCAKVSLASMPSHGGGFDSSDVLALSLVSFRRGKIENRTRSSIKDERCLEMVRDRLQVIEHERPAKQLKPNEELPSC
ncbi:hypothetical protein ACHAXT_004478 [Thalassiosira profunda]